MFATVGPAALCAAVLGLETARAALDLGQHRIAMQANIAQRLVRGPVLQLALLVAIPHTAASSAPLHLLLDLAALVAHAKFVAHIDRVAIGLLNMLTGSSQSVLVLSPNTLWKMISASSYRGMASSYCLSSSNSIARLFSAVAWLVP